MKLKIRVEEDEAEVDLINFLSGRFDAESLVEWEKKKVKALRLLDFRVLVINKKIIKI